MSPDSWCISVIEKKYDFLKIAVYMCVCNSLKYVKLYHLISYQNY